ncbi:ABC transporter permease [Candidatus Parcubacteria bacterium]|nr:ABC transporter permease [Candidatus Parcubacteria bacterium]
MIKDLKVSYFLALKAITRGNKGTLILTVLILALSFINLSFIPSLLSGVVDSMNKQSVNNLFANIIIEPGEDETYIKRVSNLQSKINSVPGVIGSSAHYDVGAVFSYDEDRNGKDVKTGSWGVRSINLEDEKRITTTYQMVVEGEYLEEGNRDKIIIGKEISGTYGSELEHRSLKGVKVGDELTLTFNNGIQREYEVKGIFNSKNVQVDTMAFITEREMESVLKLNDRASEIIVKIEQTGEEDRYIEKFRSMGIVKEEIKSWTEYMGMAQSMIKSFAIVKLILVAIGLLVAAITIFIVIFVNVVNRRKQIGILKAIGMREEIIVRSYILQSFFYAVCGVGLGFILMNFLIVPYFIAYPLSFPFGLVNLIVNPRDLFVSSLSLIVASLIGGFIPSWRAAKESIINAIWGS